MQDNEARHKQISDLLNHNYSRPVSYYNNSCFTIIFVRATGRTDMLFPHYGKCCTVNNRFKHACELLINFILLITISRHPYQQLQNSVLILL